MPEPHPDLNWPPEPQRGEDQPGEDRSLLDRALGSSVLEEGARVRSSRAQAWLAELSAGVRRVRELEAGPGVPEVLAAGFTHRVRGAVGSGFAGGGVFDRLAGIRRRQQAEKDARVDAWTETSGTGALAGRGLPPAEMIAADQRVDALARWLKAHRAPGTLDQLRAKVFTALLAGRPVADLLPAPARPSPGAGTGGGPAESGWPGLSGSVNLTMPLTAWLGLSGQPGEVAGLGPLDAGACRDLADLLARHPATRWCITLTGPGGRAVAHGCARAGPRSPRGEPPGAGPPGAGPPGAGPPGGRQAGSGPPGAGPMAWLTQITICGFETGTGPCAHTRETRGYRPSATLRHLIKIRDRRCSFPGCSRQAVRCDDDHTITYDQGGRTCECNLSPLCKR